MDDRQLSLESRLLQLRDEIKALEGSALTTERLKARLRELCAERARLEEELINLVVNPENSYRKRIDVMLNSLDEKDLRVIEATIKALKDAKETEDV